jgi:hypothetical protein
MTVAKIETFQVKCEGPGEVSIALVDAKGRLLIHKRIAISGSPKVYGGTRLPLTVRTTKGEVPVVPVLVGQSNSKQRLLVDDGPLAAYIEARARALKVSSAAMGSVRSTVESEVPQHPTLKVILPGRRSR